MERLNDKQKREIIGGKGITGSLLSGVGDIVKSVGGFVSNIFGAISTTIFASQAIKTSDKFELSIGDATLKVDNTVSNKAEIENQNPANNIVELF